MESLLKTGKMLPDSQGRLFFAESDFEHTFMHGADRTRGGSLAFKLRVEIPVGAKIERLSTQGVRDTVVIRTVEPVKFEVLEMYYRPKTQAGEPATLTKVVGATNIKKALSDLAVPRTRTGGGGGVGGAPASPVSRVRPRFIAARSAFRSGFIGAFSAANLASMIPDVILIFADRAAAMDAIKNIQIKFLKAGFGRGVAAGLMEFTEDEVALNLMNKVTNFRVQGMGDAAGLLTLTYIFQLAENTENFAVEIGYLYCSTKSGDWKKELRAKGLDTLSKQGYPLATIDLFDFPFINELAYVIRFTTDAIVAPAIRFT